MRILKKRPRDPDRLIAAVRRDWSDGTHEFVCNRSNAGRALVAARRDANYWRPGLHRQGPVSPTITVVQMTQAAFDAHTQDCREKPCPQTRILTTIA